MCTIGDFRDEQTSRLGHPLVDGFHYWRDCQLGAPSCKNDAIGGP